MPSQNKRALAITVGSLLLIAVFVGWRAQSFHYCVQANAREQKSRYVDASEVCAPNEEPMVWPELWRREGLRSKFRTVGRTVAEAFGLH